VFGIDSGELLIIAVVALVVIGPRDLPRMMRTIGHWAGRARGMARHFRLGIDTMMREAELEEMEKKWKADNERIMHENPQPPADSDWGKPPPEGDEPPKPKAPPAPRALPGGAPPIPRAGVAPVAPPADQS
jgi:sec-independent protein translocase protein TatB